MTALELTIPFGLGLMSSLHCVQMCGPIVLAYSLPLRGAPRSGAWAHLSYNSGRLITYGLMGALAGAVGGRLAGLQRAATIGVGAAMLVAAVLMAGWLPRQTLVRLGGGPGFVSRLAGRLLSSPAPGQKLLLGLVLGLLPCGMVYAALLKAVNAGSAAAGAATMVAFGLGTAGALLAIGVFSSAITARLGRHANTIAAVSVALLGMYLLWRGIYASPSMGCHHGH